MNSWLIRSRETGESFGIFEAETEDSAISALLAENMVSPYDADPSLYGEVIDNV